MFQLFALILWIVNILVALSCLFCYFYLVSGSIQHFHSLNSSTAVEFSNVTTVPECLGVRFRSSKMRMQLQMNAVFHNHKMFELCLLILESLL